MDEPEKVSATTLLSHQLSAEKHFFFGKPELGRLLYARSKAQQDGD
jgi:hypothetical protein